MNEIRKRVLTFDPEALVTQDGQPEIQPSPASLPGKKKRKNHRSKAKKSKKAAENSEEHKALPNNKAPIAISKDESSEEMFESKFYEQHILAISWHHSLI